MRPARDRRSAVIRTGHQQLALELLDKHGIALAMLSLGQPGVGFLPTDKAAAFARRCNDYAGELIARHPARFGCFGLVPMHDIDAAIAEARYCLETLHFEGISLFASYGAKIPRRRRVQPAAGLSELRGTVAHIHPSLHPSSKSLDLQWPGFMIEYPFDTTRAAVNLLFSGALETFRIFASSSRTPAGRYPISPGGCRWRR